MLKYFTFITLFIQIYSLAAQPLIQLPNGQIQGREATTLENKSYYAFEAIPYASPPIGNLRFQPPKPIQNWEGILNTTHLEVTCFQVARDTDFETEDCLYLNVFTPQLPSEDTNVSLPVMFYIHGGGFIGGSSMGSAPDLFINNDIILVTINYRLGLFGFTSTQDTIIPGNNGLKDQQFALQWVHNNIPIFGGDPDKITIFGQSAGSASCAYQLLNQNNKGLFQGVILESGSFLSPWAYQRKAREIAFATASYLDPVFATSNDSQMLLDFLMLSDARDLDAAATQYRNLSDDHDVAEIAQGFFWAPVIEVRNPSAFITNKMFGLLQAGNVLKVPVMIGMTSEESLVFNTDEDVLRVDMGLYDENPALVVPNDVQIIDDGVRTEVGLAIRDIYTGGGSWVDHLGGGVRYSSDNSFTRSIIKHAEIGSQFAETYFYQFSYYGEMNQWNIEYDGAEKVQHGAELHYIFCTGNECDDSSYPESDRITRQRLIKLWTDFAKYRVPTPQISDILQNITWPFLWISGGRFPYLDIGENLEIKSFPKNETYIQWNYLYDSLGYNDFDTY